MQAAILVPDCAAHHPIVLHSTCHNHATKHERAASQRASVRCNQSTQPVSLTDVCLSGVPRWRRRSGCGGGRAWRYHPQGTFN